MRRKVAGSLLLLDPGKAYLLIISTPSDAAPSESSHCSNGVVPPAVEIP